MPQSSRMMVTLRACRSQRAMSARLSRGGAGVATDKPRRKASGSMTRDLWPQGSIRPERPGDETQVHLLDLLSCAGGLPKVLERRREARVDEEAVDRNVPGKALPAKLVDHP